MKKTKWLAACIAAMMSLLVMGCGGGGDDGEPDDAENWVIEGTTVVRYTGVKANVRIPDGVTAIGEDAFRDNTNLKSVTIPDGVESIGSGAFSYCTSLVSVTIGNGVTSIGSNAFVRCTSLVSVTIPASVTSIGGGAFSTCTSLASVTIPDSVKSIGGAAFGSFGGSRLKEVNYGGTVNQWRSIKNSSDNGGATITGVIFVCASDLNGENVIIVCQDGKLRWVEADSNWIRKPDPSTQ